jgi:hypothetical protein
MSTTVHRPLIIIAFNANGTERQTYEVRKQLQDLKINMSLFSDTPETSHEALYSTLRFLSE